MKALIQTGSSLSACGHAQAGGRVPVPLKSDFLSILHLKIVRKNGAQKAKKHDREFSYKEGLEILGCNEEAILDAVERLRKCRKELVHEKAFHDSGEIKIAENEADNAYWLIVAIEKYFATASNPPIPD
jgi:hypothetical protein